LIWNLLNETKSKKAIITLGKEGLVTFDRNPRALDDRLRSEYLPALSTHAVDPLGCGDALLATASLTLAAGGSLQAASFLGSIAAALEVQELGNQPLSADRLLSYLHQRDTLPATARLAS
jgi:sugar/nucleoside kinase (ribokinase family)